MRKLSILDGTPLRFWQINLLPILKRLWLLLFSGDVATREGGLIYFKLSNQNLIVTYANIGPYGAGDDTKASTLQLIIIDGTDPLTRVGQYAAFYYKDMQWTTGTASSGAGGFGGTPATVGINKGNNAEYNIFRWVGLLPIAPLTMDLEGAPMG